jgi:hypothetical protein
MLPPPIARPAWAGSPAVVVHGLAQARAALAPGLPVTLLSAPGAALYAGCGWWRALVRAASEERPGADPADILDCADAPGRALEALRIGQRALVLLPGAPGRDEVAATAAAHGAALLDARPPALDLGDPRAARDLARWLRGRDAAT